MSHDPHSHRGSGGDRRWLAFALFAIVCGCGEGSPAPMEVALEADAPTLEALTELPPSPPELFAPTPDPHPAPAPDPEALARAREEAARARLEREYPWHGVAYHFLAQIHTSPDRESPVMGYMRRGARFRAQPTLRGPGCERGWSRVPGGGFVCRGEGFKLGETPQSFEPSPVGAALDDALPYPYAWVVRNDVPQYWRLPTAEEERQARAWIERQREPAEATESTAPDADTEGDGPVEAPEPDLEAPPGLSEEVPEDAEAEETQPPATQQPETQPANLRRPSEELPTDAPDEKPPFLRMRMRRGFYVSIDRMETLGERRFYRTIRGGYVPAEAVAEARPPSMRGVVLGGRWKLPLGFVYRGGVRTLHRDPARGVLALGDRVARLTPLPLKREIVMRRAARYRVSDRGQIVREDALRIAEQIERPRSIPESVRWIHIDLERQVLVAYEGDGPVFATLVSTGRPGYETPTGTFRIQSKHVSTTMDDPNAGAEAYSIEDVPWTMYFENSYALHGAFWHDRFGWVRSHGCVNLAPVDARWIFNWSEPDLPPGWHGLSTSAGEGTFIHITEQAFDRPR